MTQQGSTQVEIAVDIGQIDQALHHAPTIYIDGAHGLIANEQMVKFNLFQDRLTSGRGEPNRPIERVVCARLVMSPATFKAVVDWLSNNAKTMFPSQGG